MNNYSEEQKRILITEFVTRVLLLDEIKKAGDEGKSETEINIGDIYERTEFITNGIMKTEVNQELYRIIQELVEGI